jgi:hypothetical protein
MQSYGLQEQKETERQTGDAIQLQFNISLAMYLFIHI